MSYETYIAIRQYKDSAEKEAVRKEAYSKMWMYVDKDGKLKVPYPLSWSYEYTIIQLIEIVNKYDWDCVDAVLYGR